MQAEIVDRLAARLTPICAEAVRQVELRGIIGAIAGGVLLVAGLVMAYRSLRAAARIADFWTNPPGRWVCELFGGGLCLIFGLVLTPIGIMQWLTPLATMLSR